MSRRPPFSLYSGATRPDPVVLATPRTRCKRAAAHSPLCLVSTSTPSQRAGLDPDSRLKMGRNATLALLPLGKQRLGAKAPLGMTYKMQPDELLIASTRRRSLQEILLGWLDSTCCFFSFACEETVYSFFCFLDSTVFAPCDNNINNDKASRERNLEPAI